MKFKFECPYCGQRISATEADVNTVGVCPACQQDVNVPPPPADAASTAVAPESAAEVAPVPSPQRPPPVPSGTPAPMPPMPWPPAMASEQPPSRPAKPAAAPMRPAERAVPPVPAPRPAPVYAARAPEPEWQENAPRSGLPIFAFLFCAIPIPGLILLRIAGLGSIARFEILLGGAAFVCLLGIILAHRGWWRSKGRVSARLLSFTGLLLGYCSALIMGFMLLALDTGGAIARNPLQEPPDFTPPTDDITNPKPAATPVAVAVNTPPETPPVEKPAPEKIMASNTPAATPGGGEPASDQAFFEGKIRPILVDKCYKCHSAESGKSKGGLVVDTREGLLKGGETGPGIEPGKPDSSLLIKAVLYTDDNLQMPPKGDRLSNQEVADLTAWVKMGAPFPPKP